MIESRPQKYDRARAKTAERFLLKLNKKFPVVFVKTVYYIIFFHVLACSIEFLSTREVERTLKRKNWSANGASAPPPTLTLFSCSPNFPRTQ